jgi:hypothetical protein
MEKTPRPTRNEIARRIDQAWREMQDEIGFSPAEGSKNLNELNLSPEVRVGQGLTLGMFVGQGSLGKGLAREIKTPEQLEEAMQLIRQLGEVLPTAFRQASKEIARKLPRRGGPGRQPKLSPKEASKACDHIAMFIRQKHTLKQALQMMSESSPSILGKKVSARTLQKAWDNRDKLTG